VGHLVGHMGSKVSESQLGPKALQLSQNSKRRAENT
jgi:hypothetical protein